MDKIKKIIPLNVLSVLRVLRSKIFWLIDSNKPYLSKIKYCGYYLFYTKKQALINRIRFLVPDRIYERQISEKIVSLMKDNDSCTFIDIGSNIGLISLFVLSKINKCKIYAFEPGPHQFKLFDITIFANKLGNNIELKQLALSNKIGETDFYIHRNEEDCSGDGMVATGRGGETCKIVVKTSTLDELMNNSNTQFIKSVIKIDTEGSELMVLQGGTKFITENTPTIILEITNLNLRNYDYSAVDLIDYFSKINYVVKTIDDKPANKSNIEQLLDITDTYIAYPKHRK